MDNQNIYECFGGADIESRQIMKNRDEFTFDQIVAEAIRINAKIIIDCPKKAGGGKYYLKGMDFDWDFCRTTLINSPRKGENRQYYRKRAWLLKNIP